jgi:hypothetical protein
MNKPIYYLLIATIAVISFNQKMYGQLKYIKGYVVQIKGDTLKGEIEINPKKEADAYRKIKIRAGAGLPIKNFTADKINGYGTDSAIFVTKKIDGESQLFKQLRMGKLNLYEGRTEMMQNNKITLEPDFFTEKDGDLISIQDKPNKFKKQMTGLMADNAAIVTAIEEEKYTYANLKELFEEYNK